MHVQVGWIPRHAHTLPLSLFVLRDGKAVHLQQVRPLLVDRVTTLTCSRVQSALEHASVVHLAPCSIHQTPWTVYAHARIMGWHLQ